MSKTIKCLGMNLTKEVQSLYSENYKLLLKEIKENLNKWKDNLCLWIDRLNIVRMVILFKLIYIFNIIPLLVETDKQILKFIWKCKGIKTALKKSKARAVALFTFKIFYKSCVVLA